MTITAIALSGCSLAETISTADVCAKAAAISTDFAEVGLLLATNPLGADTYLDRLKESNSELMSLKPLDEELARALSEGTSGIDDLLGLVDDPTAEDLSQLPEIFARTQLAFWDAARICEKYSS